jgi:hypothetical protein
LEVVHARTDVHVVLFVVSPVTHVLDLIERETLVSTVWYCRDHMECNRERQVLTTILLLIR